MAAGISEPGGSAEQPRGSAGQTDGHVTKLLGLRDELAAAASLVVALAMACRSLDIGRGERGALLELASTARDRLEVVLATLDALISGGSAP